MDKNLIKLYIWGTGHWAKIFLESALFEECAVIGAIDSNIQKQNTIWENEINVYSPEVLEKNEFDYVILAMLNFQDVLKMCYEMNIPNKKVIIFTDLSKKYEFIDYHVLAQLMQKEMISYKKRSESGISSDIQQIKIERQWYESEKKYYIEERKWFREAIQKIEEEQKRIEIERQWYEVDKENLANMLNEKVALVADLENRIKHEQYKLTLLEEMAPYEYGTEQPSILSAELLLKRLIKEKLSLVRFGDGEFDIILRNERAWFQKGNEHLAVRLQEILQVEQECILTAIADIFGDLKKYTSEAAFGIRDYLKDGKRKKIIDLLDDNKIFYDAYVSRPYIMYRDKNHAKVIFDLFTQMWKDRNILLVEGALMHTGCGNELFKTANTVRRILCPPVNAYDYYDEILNAIVRNYRDDDLVLIGLGPTATVLAYDVSLKGIQAIDLGQIDNEYEWYKMGTTRRMPIEGKAVPELSQETTINLEHDIEYENQIVEKIGL